MEHVGDTLLSGHYICYARVGEGESMRWFRFDDESVAPWKWGGAERKDPEEVCANPYILFYKRAPAKPARTPNSRREDEGVPPNTPQTPNRRREDEDVPQNASQTPNLPSEDEHAERGDSGEDSSDKKGHGGKRNLYNYAGEFFKKNPGASLETGISAIAGELLLEEKKGAFGNRQYAVGMRRRRNIAKPGARRDSIS